MGRRIFLAKTNAKEALDRWRRALAKANWPQLDIEEIETCVALNRITAHAVFAQSNAPSFPSCAMDGIACRASDTMEASESRPVELESASIRIVNTGNPLPGGFDAVIKIENTQATPDGGYRIHAAVPPWHNVRQIGENAVKGTQILPSNTPLTPQAQALLLSAGVLHVAVWARPHVTIIPTGDELRSPDSVEPETVPEYNSAIIRGHLESWGARCSVSPIVADDRGLLRKAVETALDESDMVVINAGSSAGTHDFAADVVQELGTLLVHGVELRPGKPMLLGVAQGLPIVGLPGYPVAALTDLHVFVRPIIDGALGQAPCRQEQVRALAATTIPSVLGDLEVVRGKLVEVSGATLFHPLPRGSASLASAVRADCILEIDSNTEGVREGDPITVSIRDNSRLDLKRAVIAVGSHDLLMDLLIDRLRQCSQPVTMDSLHVGSMGGLRSIARDRCHIAGIHLLDPKSGTYNTSFIERFVKGNYGLVHVSHRDQGLMVAPGNPKKISDLSSLTRKEITFVNRQRGSGTRVLLDILLDRSALDPDAISGYQREETTHIAVAIRVANGFADAGLGIKAAATSLGLDFIALEREQYDLLVNADFFHSEPAKELWSILSSDEFRQAANELGGYDVSESGSVLKAPEERPN